MSIKYESGFSTILGLSLNSTDTVITLGAVPTVTKGRMYIFDGTQKEWVDFTGVSGVTITGCTRNVSSTADPMTGGTGYNFNAGTPVVLVAMHDQLPDKTTANTWVGDQTITGNASISGLLSFTGTDTAGLKIKSLTTTQRDALTPTTGMKIYNSTTGTEQTYYGGTWNDAGTSTVANATDAITGKVRLADQTQVDNGTDTEAGDPLVVIPSTLKVVTDALAIRADLFLNVAFGSGSDGDVTIAGTVTLTRDMFYNNLVIPSGQTLNPNGYRFFVKGTMSGTGNITITGNNGSAGETNLGGGAAGGSGGAALNQGTINYASAGGAGGAGGNAAGTTGTAGTAKNPSLTNVNGVAGGAGGFGLSGAGVAGGAGGASTRGDYYNQVFPMGLLHPATQGTVLNYLAGATSGGGSGGTGANAGPSDAGGGGGGAGSNGGTVRCAVKIWNFTGIVALVGGNGGNGGVGGHNGGGGGGGGGGCGGILLRMYHTLTNDATIILTGGTGGTGGAATTGTSGAGSNGTAGATGVTISIVI